MTSAEVEKWAAEEQKREKRNFDHSHLKGGRISNNRFLSPKRISTVRARITKSVVNVEGNEATIVIEAEAGDPTRKTSKLSEDERKMRRMKNRQRRLVRLLRKKPKHGRTSRSAS